jgi:DNA-binding MarR family transcriptional regulator
VKSLRNFGFLIKDVSRLHSKNFERHTAELGLTLAQCKVLAYLERNEGISQIRLAELSDTDAMTLVRILDRMERDGWIERRAHPSDRRARQLFLRQGARPVITRMQRLGDLARTAALAGLSAGEREQLMNLLERVHGNLLSLMPGDDDAAAASLAQPRTVRRPARRKAVQ